jgi:DNA-binding winged helix-turn-helix (wHTH) protein
MSFEFGEFILDPPRQELRRDGEVIHLTPKAMHLLEILIENRPNVVSHQKLYDRLWPDVVVVEANLKNLVADLRHALDDHDREGRFLRTVHGRGYAFTENVIETRLGTRPPDRIVMLMIAGERIVLQPGENIIGRGRDANVVIESHEVSRHHARIVLAPAEMLIEDLQSKNGTFVEGERITGPRTLVDGDHIRFGTFPVIVRVITRTDESTTDSSDRRMGQSGAD